jgi:hypothetical protein
MVELYHKILNPLYTNKLGEDAVGDEGRLGQRHLLTKHVNDDRTVAERTHRAEDYKVILDKREDIAQAEDDKEKVFKLRSEIRDVLSRAKNRREIYSNFLNPDNIKHFSVDMGELGIQEANYIDLSFSETDFKKPPIIYIPGISAGTDGSGELALEVALYLRRRIIILDYPESPQGKVTKAFHKAVSKSNNFGPHVEFFKKAINFAIGENLGFDFCGVSTGSIMASEISKDKNFANRIGLINLLVPPGLTKLRAADIKKRWKMESESTKKMEEDGSIGKKLVSNYKVLNRSKADVKATNRTLLALGLKLIKEYKWWEGMDSKARIIIARSDGITYGIKNIDKLKNNPNLSVEIVDGGHNELQTNAKVWIEKMVS